MNSTLSCPVLDAAFPSDTVDPGFTFTVTGTLADGSSFSTSATSTSPTQSFDLQPGTYFGSVSKLGVSSKTSEAKTISAPATITLSVPDPGQPAAFS